MTTKPLHWKDITTDPLIVRIKDVGAEAIAGTTVWKKRSNSLTSAAQVILQLANIAALLLTDVHWGVTLVIAVVVGLAEVIMQARTKTPVTPHVVETLVEAAARPAAAPMGAHLPSGLPRFDRD